MECSARRRGRRRFAGVVAAVAAVVLMAVAAPAVAAPHASGVTADDGARVVAVEQVAPRQVDLAIDSPALGTTAKVRLLTPDGWGQRLGRSWPELWLLHGCCNDYTAWTAASDVASIGALRHVLVVMPEAGRTGFYSDWKGGTPGWERFHLQEVRQIVERGYGGSGRRAVAGLSMGGFGALSYAARHPGMFRAAASYSGVVDTTYPDGGVANVQQIVTGEGADPAALWGDPVADASVWAAHNPYDLAGRLRGIPTFLSCGNGEPGPLDPPGTGFNDFEHLFSLENQALADRLHDLGAAHLTTDFYGPGTHSAAYWQRELHRSLPMLLRAIGA